MLSRFNERTSNIKREINIIEPYETIETEHLLSTSTHKKFKHVK